MFPGVFNNLSEADKNSAIEAIIQHATPRQDFFLMLTLSVSMAAFGIILNSVVVLIGSMLIAPLLFPLLSLSLGIIVADSRLRELSFHTIFKSIGYALIASAVIGFLFSKHDVNSVGLPFNASDPAYSLIYVVVAAIAGFAAAFAMTKPYLNDTLPGVAIAVALVPPLAAAGVAIASFNWSVFSAALLLFVVNIIGIVASAVIVFALMGFAVKKTVTKEVVKEEEKVIKKEAAIIEKEKAEAASDKKEEVKKEENR